MSTVRSYFRSFSGGEVSPEFWGQFTDGKYQTGLALCRNFMPLPHGPVASRPGTHFVREAKLGGSGLPVRLIPFEFSTDQTMVLEFGAGYVRFHTLGATLMKEEDQPYEVVTPYAQEHLFEIHHVQSADVLTLVHPSYPPKELRRLGASNWVLVDISFSPSVSAPATVSGTATTATSPSNLRDYVYKVTAKAENGEESLASTASVTLSNNLLQTGAYNTITWGMSNGAKRYCVYLQENGLFGYIGETDGLTFKDENIAPDLGKTPPISGSPFSTPGGIKSVPVTAGGSGYSSTTSGGTITSITLASKGDGYTSPSVSLTDPTGSGASISIKAVESAVSDLTGSSLKFTTGWEFLTYNILRRIAKKVKTVEITINSGGTGYTMPVITITDPTGSGAVAAATVSPITGRSVKLAINDPTGVGAEITPVISGGVITGINVIKPGSGYTSPTVVVVDAGGGSGATFGTPVVDSNGDYPGAVSYFEQRRVFAGTELKPQNMWMTRSGTESNMNYSIPTRDDDSVQFRIAARQVNAVRHILPLTSLLLMTSSGEWRVTSADGGAITPSSVMATPQSYVGCSNVQPIIVNNNVIFAAARGGHMREMAYNADAQGYLTGDLSLRAPHLFDGKVIMDMAYTKSPFPVIWAVSSDGTLLGLTYVPEQQIAAWHRHDTGNGDEFLSICSVVEAEEDAEYVAVRRTIEGVKRVYIERFASRRFDDVSDSIFVDSAVTYEGDPVDTLSGLDHLEGRTVSILVDGAVHPQRVVVDGSVSLDVEGSTITVGLPIEADVRSLPLAFDSMGFGQGRVKNINKVWLRVHRSSGVRIGPSFDRLNEHKQRTNEPMGTPPVLTSDEIEMSISPSWQSGAQFCVRQADPLPLTIVAMCMEASVAG